jgi:hypothetical protein
VTPPGRGECSAGERAIIKQHNERRRDHDLLAEHAERAGSDGQNPPPDAPRGVEAARETPEREQEEEPIIASVRWVRSVTGLHGKRMHEPGGGRQPGEGAGGANGFSTELGRLQRSPRQPE